MGRPQKQTTLLDHFFVKQLTATEQLLFPPNSASSGLTLSNVSIDNGFVRRLMDSNDLECERSITILFKCTSVNYDGNLINIVDKPGHADFCGDVEQVMSTEEGMALVVDTTEGPTTQTQFVLAKALNPGLKPPVGLNEGDPATSHPAQVESDLFAMLGGTFEQGKYHHFNPPPSSVS